MQDEGNNMYNAQLKGDEMADATCKSPIKRTQ